MRFVDLSAPITASPAELPEPLRTDVEYSGHAEGAAQIAALFGVGPELLRDGEGWATDFFTRLGTHNSTHVDAPWHYNSIVAGERAQTIEELPLEWFLDKGVVLDFHHKEDGAALASGEVQRFLGPIARELRAGDVVLVPTGGDEFLDAPDYM